MAVADLHLHTTASDGRLTPSQLIHLVGQRGLKLVAITDHDSTEGLAEAFQAASAFPGLTVIPGIELGTDIPGAEVHILGYWMDYQDPAFQATLTRFRQGREQRARRMVEKLAALGIAVEWERVVDLAQGGSIGRPHIAHAMVEKGYIAQPQEAFQVYLGRNGLAYAEREKLTPEEAVRMLLQVGGVPVLAHPLEGTELTPVLPGLRQAGLMGMEVYYKGYTSDQVQVLKERAAALGLMTLGGSDYHAFGTPGEVEPGSVGPPAEAVEELLALTRSRP